MSTAAVSTSGPEGMPASYSQSHGREERMAHAAIVGRRGDGLVHVEQCPGPVQKGAPTASWLCVVTDDRPGLLSLLSADDRVREALEQPARGDAWAQAVPR